jgi:Fic family protein
MHDIFIHNPLWHEQIGKIYALLERVKITEQQTKEVLHLRRKNRILSVGSTTAIEGNRLTEQQVFDVINGKTVFAPPYDIKEVKNAFAAYEQIPELNPYSLEDFLRAHRFITENLVEESGRFRSVAVSVVNSQGEILHSGADCKEVPALIAGLLEWGKTTGTHALIKSSVMHFMIEHIHPFRDGNGRIGRLWQTLVLTKWNEIFAWLPVETMIYHNQAKYYEALHQSHKDGVECSPFIDFMLQVIEDAIDEYVDGGVNGGVNGGVFRGLSEIQKEIIALIQENPHIRAFGMSQKLVKPVRTIENNLRQLKDKGVIGHTGSDKTGCWVIRVPLRRE